MAAQSREARRTAAVVEPVTETAAVVDADTERLVVAAFVVVTPANKLRKSTQRGLGP